MRVLVTGAAGFIGAALAERLLERGDHVIAIDNLNAYYPVSLKRDRLERLRARGGARFDFVEIDFAEGRALSRALDGTEFARAVHLGAQAGVRHSLDNPQPYVASNLIGHFNLLEAARHRKLEHFVYASSSSVYGANAKVPFSTEDRVDHPLSLYAATKKADELMSEAYAHLYRLPMTGLRFFTVYGPWGRPDMMMWLATAAILEKRPVRVFNNGEMWRDFTYIDDIVAGVVAALDSPPPDDGSVKAGGGAAPHAIYNLGNNRPEHLMKVISLIEAACGREAQLELLPMQAGDVPRTFADISVTGSKLGFAPTTSIEIGIPRFVEWYRRYHGL
jgi:UDP-glucuronate 4-epimerase